jgi:hypothetical protein
LACNKSLTPLDDPATAAPGPVMTPTVTNTAGGAIIAYALPKDQSLWYVKAEYEIRPGVKREVKSSFYTSTIEVEGFADTTNFEVKLYAVGRNEKASNPVNVVIRPLPAPVLTTAQSVVMIPDFGGMNLSFENEHQADLSIEVSTPDSTGEWQRIETYFTNSRKGDFSVRGFTPAPRKFKARVKDRWGNVSEEITREITPIYEELIAKNIFKELTLPTDSPTGFGWVMTNLWNNTNAGNGYHTPYATGMPQQFTFDMGATRTLSRMKYWQRTGTHLYNTSNPKRFEIWGSAAPDPDGGWTNWIRLGEFESVKPSGLPLGQTNAEDLARANAGEDFTFPITVAVPVRYIRFKTLETWGNTDYITIMEITLWGGK